MRRSRNSRNEVSASLLFLVILAGSLVACSPPPSLAPHPTSSIADSTIRANDLLERLDARYLALVSFRGLAEMQYTGPNEKAHVKQVVAVERPDHLRIEMMSAVGVALQVTSDGKRLRAYHRGEKTFYTGEATAENLARFTRLDLDVRDIADLLVGLPPARKRTGRAEIAFEEATGLWRVTVPLADGGRQILWFDRDRLLPTRTEEIDAQGSKRYETRYGDYRVAEEHSPSPVEGPVLSPVEGLVVPHEIALDAPAQDESVRLRYSNVSANEPLAESLFRFEPPPGVRQVNLDAP